MNRTQLPPRPIELTSAFRRRQFVGIALLVGLSAILIAVLVVTASDIPEILRDARVFATGATAEHANVTGTTRDKLFFRNYKLDVDYDTPSGSHHGVREIETIAGDANLNADAVVHYDREHPEVFAVSWAVEVQGGRWAYVGVMSAVMLGFAAVMLFGVRQIRAASARTAAIARDGDEIVAEVLAIRQTEYKGKPQHNFAVTWRASSDQVKPFVSVIDSRAGTVAWIEGAPARKALALLNGDRSAGILLRSDLYPLALEADERERLERWLAERGGGKARGPLAAL